MTPPTKADAAPEAINLNKEPFKTAISEGKAAIKEGKSKTDAAVIMFKRIKDEPRDAGVAALKEGAGLTDRGAMTYWYNCHRKLRSSKLPRT